MNLVEEIDKDAHYQHGVYDEAVRKKKGDGKDCGIHVGD